MCDHREPSDDDPQGGYDILCWRTNDGIGHRFDDETYTANDVAEWKAMCGADIDSGEPDLNDPVDCMTCIVKEACRDTE